MASLAIKMSRQNYPTFQCGALIKSLDWLFTSWIFALGKKNRRIQKTKRSLLKQISCFLALDADRQDTILSWRNASAVAATHSFSATFHTDKSFPRFLRGTVITGFTNILLHSLLSITKTATQHLHDVSWWWYLSIFVNLWFYNFMKMGCLPVTSKQTQQSQIIIMKHTD